MPNLDYPTYLNIALYSTIAIGALIGFMRGFKKSIYSFITTLIFYVVFFVTIEQVVVFLWTFENTYLSQLFGLLGGDLSQATSFAQAAPMALSLYLGEDYAEIIANEHFLELATGIGMFALKIVYTLLYFTIIFIIYKFICWIIRMIFFGGSKKNDKYVSKNRGLGLLFGAMEGAIGLYVTLIILGGVFSITESLVNFVPEETPEEVVMPFPRDHLYEASYTLLAETPTVPALPPEIYDMIEELKGMTDAYNANILVSTTSTITMTDAHDQAIPLNLYLFDEILSFEYEDNQVSLRKELSNFATIGAYVMDMEYMETQDLADISGDHIRDIFDMVSQSDLIVNIMPLGIELAAVYLEAPLDFPTEDLYAIDWATELNQLGTIAATTFDIISTAGFLEGTPAVEQIEVTGDEIRDLFDTISESELITLAAFVAVDSLLEAATEDIQAVLTLPAGVEWEDISWENEFMAIGSILGAVLDTGLSPEEIGNGDYDAILTAVSNLEFTVILESKIVCYSLINVLSGAVPIEGLDEFLVVPDGIEWLIYDTDGVTIIGGELQNILEALGAMSSIMDTIDFDNLTPEVLTDLSDDSIDTIFESEVLVASLSSVILSMDLGDYAIIVPSTSVDENYYIIKDEMKSVLKAAKLILKEPVCEPGDEVCENQEPDYIANALSLTSDEIDTLIESNILKATVGNLLNDMNQDPLVIPPSALGGVEIAYPEDQRGETLNLVTGTEIKNVLLAVGVFGITDFGNMVFDASLIENLESETMPGDIDEDKITTIFNSDIIHATLSNVILDLVADQPDFIVVPYFKEDNDAEIRYFEGDIEYIDAEELKVILRGFYSLDIDDFDNMESEFDIPVILENIDLLLGSSVLQATISKQLLDLSETVIIPTTYYDDEDIVIEVGNVVDGTQTTYILREELERVFNSLNTLGITDPNAVSLDASILGNLKVTDGEALDEAKLDILFGSDEIEPSAIIHATLSDVILDMMNQEDSYIVVPHFGLDDTQQSYPVLELVEGIDYIALSELRAAMIALNVFNLDEAEGGFDAIESVVTIETVLNHISVLLDSAVLHATVSKQLLDLSETVIVPETYYDDEAIVIEVGNVVDGTQTTYIIRDELERVFNSLNTLGITDPNSVTLDASILGNLKVTDGEALDEAKLDILFGSDEIEPSAIIHATLSDVILDMMNQEDSYIVVPHFGLDDTQQSYPVLELVEGIDYIALSELRAAMIALNVFNLDEAEGGFDAIESAVTIETVLNHISILLDSAVLHATISKQLLDMTEEIVVPTNALNDDPIRISTGDALSETETIYITRDELQRIFDALDVLEISDPNAINFDATIIRKLEDTNDDDADEITTELSDAKLNTLFASSVIHATVSKMLFDLTTVDNPYVVVPESGIDETNTPYSIQETAYSVSYVITDELEKVLIALYALNIANFDTIADELTLDVILANIETLLDSSILHATVSNQILTIEAEMIVIPETYGTGIDETNIRILAGTTEYIVKDELVLLFDALDLLGFENFTVSLDASIINRLEDTEDEDDDLNVTELSNTKMNQLFESVIIHASFSKMFFDQTTASGDNAIVVVPTQDIDSNVITYSESTSGGSYDYIDILEIKHALIALHALNITDLTEVDGLMMDTLIANLDALLASAIMHATVSNQLIDMTDDGFLIVPYKAADNSTEIRKTVASTEFIIKSELTILFESMQTLGVIGDLSAFAGELNYSPLFDPAQRDTLLESAIIHVMISDTLVTLDPTILTVPYYEEEGMLEENKIRILVGEIGFFNEYIVKTEIHAVFNALNELGISGDIETDFNGTLVLDPLFIEESRNIILGSSIVQLRVSKEIFELGTEIISIPYYKENNLTPVRITVGVDLEASEYVSLEELNAMFIALPILGVDYDIQEFNGNVDLSALYETDSRNQVLSSATLQGRISKELIGLGVETLVVPYTAADDATLVRLMTDGTLYQTEYISQLELGYMFEALEALGVTIDIQSFTGLSTLNALYDSTTRGHILDSAIVHAKISDELIKLDDSVLAIPYVDDEESIIRDTVGSVGFENEYIIETELDHLFTAIDLLTTEDTNLLDDNFTGTFDLSPLFVTSDRNTILESAIIHGKISEEMMNLGATILEIPYGTETYTELDELTHVVLTVGPVGQTTNYIQEFELTDLFEGLNVLGISGDILAFNGDVNLSAFYDPLQRDTILDSSILQAKISREMFNLGEATLTVPLTDIDGTTVRQLVGPVGHQTDYIFVSEINNLFAAMSVLGLSGDTNFGGSTDVNLANVATLEAQNTLLSSATMHATISNIIVDLDDTSGIMVVPNYTVNGVAELNRVRKTVSSTDFVVKSEVSNLINALNAMGYSNMSISASIDASKFFTEKDTILISSIMQATISEQFLVDAASVLFVPNEDVENLNEPIRITVDTTEFVTNDELKALLDALAMIGLDNMTNFSAINISISSLFGPGVVFADMMESASVQATISDSFLDVAIDETERVAGGSSLVITQYHRQNYTSGINNLVQVEENELVNLLTALQQLGFSSYGDAISATTIQGLTDESLTTILTSGSMHVTIDNMLAGNPNISVPNKARVGGNLTTSLYGINALVQANELKYFILAAKALGGADFTNVDFDYTAINSLSSENQTIVLTSMIVRNMITPELVTGVNGYNDVPSYLGGPDPVLYDPIPNNFYEDSDPLTFLTASAILTLIDYLPL